MSERPIAWGWVPNISGKVTSPEYLSGLFSEPYDADGNGFKFTMKLDGGAIQCYSNEVAFAVIKMEDYSGLCRIYDLTGIRCNLTDTDESSAPFISKYRALWAEFRLAIDGCSSSVYNCTAMDLPVPFEFADEERIYRHLAELFIEKLEEITDSENYIRETIELDDVSSQMLNDIRDDCSKSGNTLYFERFVDIYKDKLGDECIEDYKSQIKCRIRKDAILRDYHNAKNNVLQSEKTHDLAGASNGLAVASNKLSKIAIAIAIVTTIINLTVSVWNKVT